MDQNGVQDHPKARIKGNFQGTPPKIDQNRPKTLHTDRFWSILAKNQKNAFISTPKHLPRVFVLGPKSGKKCLSKSEKCPSAPSAGAGFVLNLKKRTFLRPFFYSVRDMGTDFWHFPLAGIRRFSGFFDHFCRFLPKSGPKPPQKVKNRRKKVDFWDPGDIPGVLGGNFGRFSLIFDHFGAKLPTPLPCFKNDRFWCVRVYKKTAFCKKGQKMGSVKIREFPRFFDFR